MLGAIEGSLDSTLVGVDDGTPLGPKDGLLDVLMVGVDKG